MRSCYFTSLRILPVDTNILVCPYAFSAYFSRFSFPRNALLKPRSPNFCSIYVFPMMTLLPKFYWIDAMATETNRPKAMPWSWSSINVNHWRHKDDNRQHTKTSQQPLNARKQHLVAGGSVGFPARLWKPKTDKQFFLEKLFSFLHGNMGKSGKI